MEKLEEYKVSVKEIIKGSKGELIILQDFKQTKENLLAIVSKFENLEVSKETFAESKKARAELRDARFELQNISKHNNSLLNKAKNLLKDDMESLISLVKPKEDEIDEKIKEIENEKIIAKAKKEQEEVQRVYKINKRIAEIKSNLDRIILVGRTEEDVNEYAEIMLELNSRIEKDEFQEFTFEVENIREEYPVKMLEITRRVEKIKADLEREKINKKKERLLALNFHIENLDEMSLLEDDLFEKEFENLKTKSEKIKKERKEEQEKIKKEQEEKATKLKKEQEKFEKEKAEFEKEKADKKAKEDALIKEKADFEKAEKEKAEKEKAVIKEREEKEITLKEKTLTCGNLGISLSDINMNENVDVVINQMVLKIEEAEKELTGKRKDELLFEFNDHILKVIPLIKKIHTYFEDVKISKEHEVKISEFEDAIRGAFAAFKK